MKHLWWFNYGDAVHHSQCRRSLLMLWGLKEIEFNWLIVAAITDREIHYTNEHQQITLANREEPLHFSKYFSMRYWMKTLILTLSWLLTRTRTSRTWWWILVMRSVNCKHQTNWLFLLLPIILSQYPGRFINPQPKCERRDCHQVSCQLLDPHHHWLLSRTLCRLWHLWGHCRKLSAVPAIAAATHCRRVLHGPGSFEIKRP